MWSEVTRFFAHLVAASNPIWWYYPLCAVAALVYKATKYDQPKKIAWTALHFFVTVSLGMFALAMVFYLMDMLL
jgi:hypothetical protein